jgi:hypothetical protein
MTLRALLLGMMTIAALPHVAAGDDAERLTSFRPGEVWPDEEGKHINAHGPGILHHDGVYYWFGEQRADWASEGVAVYSSTDLYNWKREGLALAPVDDDPDHLIARGCIMERPKVLYNEQTGRFVLWFHHELKGRGYGAGHVGVAVSDTVTGPYEFLSSFRPNGHDSRDMTVFQKSDGSAYLVYASRVNLDLRVAQLTDDYLDVTERDELMFSRHREAPALFKHDEYIYMITSAATGWNPNRAQLHRATSIWGPWEHLGDPSRGEGAANTFGSQSAFILPVQGREDAYIYIGDRWRPGDLSNSPYVWLPIQFNGENVPFIEWMEEWDLGVFDGRTVAAD